MCICLVRIANEILMHIRASKKHAGEIYLQDIVGVDREGNEVRIEDKLADDKDTIDNQVGMRIQIKQMYEALRKVLHGREKVVIEMRYGLAGREEMTQREISSLLNISRSYVSRIEKKALLKLFKEMRNYTVLAS
ncbi:MAG: sigma-70 family RNA polymerase sigma factor [Defluviitaleaceae bacterium]|nr:sigma-70 family RNA polymerase sigma factor [Defluviitaleaceae bacterium]